MLRLGKGYCCHPCKTNYNRQQERMNGNAQLRQWWKNMTKSEKAAWFARNKSMYEQGKRKAFDNPGFFEETQTEAAVHRDDHIFAYLPLAEWIIREKLGNCGDGSEEAKTQRAIESFQVVWAVGVRSRGRHHRTNSRPSRLGRKPGAQTRPFARWSGRPAAPHRT